MYFVTRWLGGGGGWGDGELAFYLPQVSTVN